MQILLTCAKTMKDISEDFSLEDLHPERWNPLSRKPYFQNEASHFALDMSNKKSSEISALFHCSYTIAQRNKNRFDSFFEDSELLPAVFAYYGQAYRYLRADTFSTEDFIFAQKHLWIISFLYGLLRPMNYIHPYRMEGKVKLPWAGGLSISDFWKSKLTDYFIDNIIADDGILVYLSTEEFQHLFDWKRIKKSVHIIQPQFYVQREDQYKIIPTYEKAFRGAMSRYIIQNRVTTPEGLQIFNSSMLPKGKMVFL